MGIEVTNDDEGGWEFGKQIKEVSCREGLISRKIQRTNYERKVCHSYIDGYNWKSGLKCNLLRMNRIVDKDGNTTVSTKTINSIFPITDISTKIGGVLVRDVSFTDTRKGAYGPPTEVVVLRNGSDNHSNSMIREPRKNKEEKLSFLATSMRFLST